MPISMILGNLGAGKTTFATYLAIQELKKGKEVFCNWKVRYVTEDGRKIHYVRDVGRFLEYTFKKKRYFPLGVATIFFDETQMIVDSRKSSNDFSIFFTHFVSQTRKMGFGDVVFITQLQSTVDKRIRNLVDTYYLCEKKVVEKDTSEEEGFDLYEEISADLYKESAYSPHDDDDDDEDDEYDPNKYEVTFEITPVTNSVSGLQVGTPVIMTKDVYEPVWKFFDTQELIRRSALSVNTKENKKRINEILNDIAENSEEMGIEKEDESEDKEKDEKQSSEASEEKKNN